MKSYLSLLSVVASLLLLGTVSVTQGQVDQGIDVVDVVRASAAVTKIDAAKRKLSVELEDGKHKTIKVDKSVQNFDQIKVGDKLKLAYAEEMPIAVGESKDPVGAENAGLVGIAPKGAKPGGVMVETTNMTAKVVAVDPEKHHLTIQDADGKEKKMKISKKAKNLDTLKPGETIEITVTEALAIEVEKSLVALRSVPANIVATRESLGAKRHAST
jgi:predicted CoA-binding protein